MSEDVEALTEFLNARYAVYRPDTETVARAILASDWLAAYVAAERDRALTPVRALVREFHIGGDLTPDCANALIAVLPHPTQEDESA